MNILLIINILLVVSYVGITIGRMKSLPDSVSAMVYALPREWQWLWTVWLWAVAFLLAPSLMEAMGSAAILGASTLFFMLMVGVFPLFDTEHRWLHNILGIIACVLSQCCVFWICPWALFMWLPMAWSVGGSFASLNDSEDLPPLLGGKAVMVSEMICAATVFLSLFIDRW